MAALWPGYSVNSPRHGSELSSPINRAPSSATSKTGRSSAGGQPGYFDCRTLVAVVALAASLAAVLAWIVAVHDIDKKWILIVVSTVLFCLAALTLLSGTRPQYTRGLDPFKNAKQALFRAPVRPGHTHIECLDGFRGLAVCWVIVFHCTCYPSPWFSEPLVNFNRMVGSPLMQLALSGSMGVDVFFMLSGFLIATMLARQLRKGGDSSRGEAARGFASVFGQFVVGRWFRLVPAYAVLLWLTSQAGEDAVGRETCKEYWWVNLLFVNNYFDFWFGGDGGWAWGGCDMHTWTIAVEFQFYLFSIPLLWALTMMERRLGASALRPQLALLGNLALVTILLRVGLRLHYGDTAHINNFFYTRAASYLGGMAASLITLRPPYLTTPAAAAAAPAPVPGAQGDKGTTVPMGDARDKLQGGGAVVAGEEIVEEGGEEEEDVRESLQHLNESFLGFGNLGRNRNRNNCNVRSSTGSSSSSRCGLACQAWLPVVCAFLGGLLLSYLGPGDFVTAFDTPQTPLRVGPPWSWLSVDGKKALSYSLKVVSCAALGLVSAAQVVQMLRGKAKRLNAVFSSAAWVPFARVSYSAYLLQFFFIGPTYRKWCVVAVGDDYWVCFGQLCKLCCICLLIINCAALWLHVLVEAPFNNIRPGIIKCVSALCCCCCRNSSLSATTLHKHAAQAASPEAFTEDGPRMTFSSSTIYNDLRRQLLSPSSGGSSAVSSSDGGAFGGGSVQSAVSRVALLRMPKTPDSHHSTQSI